MASRAVHVEVLDDMTADAYINSLRCVTAIRGQISAIRCDQGTNFKGAARELRSEDKIDVSDKAVQQYLINKNCRFLFKPHAQVIWVVLSNVTFAPFAASYKQYIC